MKQCREVSRKANVGDRIKVINAICGTGAYKKGDVLTVIKRQSHSPEGVWTEESCIFVYDIEYVVLEPVESAEKTTNPADIRELYSLVDGLTTQIDGLCQTVASLTYRLTELERSEKYTLIASGPVSDSKPSFVPKTRDEIVEQAKKDVRELSRTPRDVYGCHPHFWPQIDGEKTTWFPIQRVDFMVNHEKRTVVVLIRSISSKTVFARGIARCAPDDCFNAHIGRAIALRRALGLTVPDEYYSAPQPTEVRVGDVVEKNYGIRRVIPSNEQPVLFKTTQIGSVNASGRIVDDSREEVGA